MVIATLGPAVVACAEDRPDPAAAQAQWPQWRGPLGTGFAPEADPPVTWDGEHNVRWKTPLPGKGHSTPIVWGDRVFVTAAVPFGDQLAPRWANRPGAHDNLPVTQHQRLMVFAIDRADGTVLWQRAVRKVLPHEGGHYTASFASASPVTDGELVFACFGSHGLYCLDSDGNVKWQTDLGDMHTKHGHGEGSSPALSGDVLVINWDHEEQSFVAAFDKRTGEERWRVDRDEVTSWSTPIITEVHGSPQLIVAGTERVRGYDLEDGSVVWACGGLSSNIVATPVADNGRVFVGSSYEIHALLAIDVRHAYGDITGTGAVLWSRRRGTPYVPSLLLVDDSLYFLRHYQNILTKVDVATGAEPAGPFRLGGLGNIYASPVAAAGRIYVTDLDGNTLVMSHAAAPEFLALNRLHEPVTASAALAGSDLLLRSDRHLFCLSEVESQ
jgi:outer membrane protein assembly factor BamB